MRDTLARQLPELLPNAAEIEQFLRDYLGVPELGPASGVADDPLADASLAIRAPNQPPLVGAGQDLTLELDGKPVGTTLQGSVVDDRIHVPEALFVTWEVMAGADGVVIKTPHALKTEATFPKRGIYSLRLTASDGDLSAEDSLLVTVNEAPTITILTPAAPQRVGVGELLWEVDLLAQIASGLGDPNAPLRSLEWNEARNATFENRKSASTKVRFSKTGSYLLTLSVDNGSFKREAHVVVEVAARVKEQLQALYTFTGAAGDSVRDVAGHAQPLNLVIKEPAKVQHGAGALVLQQATVLSSQGPLTALTSALRASNEITLEAWLKPTEAVVSGMRRIVTCSNGPLARNFTLGQSGGNYYVAWRTTSTHNGVARTDVNASRQALVAGAVTNSDVAHLVCTHNRAGLTVLYLNGKEVARRVVSGDFSGWDSSFPLVLGNELGQEPGGDPRRAWLGELRLVALYSRALRADEVVQNFEFGGDTRLPPVVVAGASRVVAMPGASVTVPLAPRITTDHPLTAMTVKWSQVSGPHMPVGVAFTKDEATFTQPGRYVLRLSADDGEFVAMDELVVVVQRPTHILHQALQEASSTLALERAVQDQPGLVADGMTYEWRQTSGPASMVLTHAEQLHGTATFTERGVYELVLTAHQSGRLWDSVPFAVSVHQPPVINAMVDQLMTLPRDRIELPHSKAVRDTGMPNNLLPLVMNWEPAARSAGAAAPALLVRETNSTFATFGGSGIYKLRFTATNPHLPELAASFELTATVNQRPEVRIATVVSQPILLRRPTEELELEAVVSDDGLPNPALSLAWSRANGAGGVSFADATAACTTAKFSAAGRYELLLTADDGAERASASVVLVVHAAPTISLPSTLSVKRREGVTLTATITQTGLADPAQGKVSITWKKLSGPEVASIATPTSNTAEVTFNGTGNFEFEAVADNGFLRRGATVQVEVRGGR